MRLTGAGDADRGLVRLEPVRLDWIEALVEGDAVFAERFSVGVEPGWSGFPEVLPAVLEAARQHDRDPWGTYLFFDRGDGALVGMGGFKGAPEDGVVEIGYAISPARRRRGLATDAARGLVERAARVGVTTVLAHTLAEPGPSASVLTGCGFIRVATVPDADLGRDVWRWSRDLR